MVMGLSKLSLLVLFLGISLGQRAQAARVVNCQATKILDEYIFEDTLNTTDRSLVTIDEVSTGYKATFGTTTYWNWEYSNIEPVTLSQKGFQYRIDDYKGDFTLYITALGDATPLAGTISVKLNPAKPAEVLAEISCQ